MVAMRVRHLVIVLVLLGMAMLCACSLASERDTADRETTLVVTCGTDVALRLNLTGHIRVPVADIMRSRCSAHVDGADVLIECPGNGRNASEILEDGLHSLWA